jgi:curved DNA-binding protein CbpA
VLIAFLNRHPDNFAQNESERKIAEKKFIDIAAAKEVLSDPEKRAQFDNGEKSFKIFLQVVLISIVFQARIHSTPRAKPEVSVAAIPSTISTSKARRSSSNSTSHNEFQTLQLLFCSDTRVGFFDLDSVNLVSRDDKNF